MIQNPFKYMKYALLLGAWGLFVSSATGSERGELTGGVMHEPPGWFKESFLEIQDDVDEATEVDKHVLLFFQLNGCPYCDRMLSEVFEPEPMSGYIQQHFDAIAINVKGDRDIAFNEKISVTEKELSEILKVRATPAILFLNAENKVVARVDGYRAPQRFQHVLDYIVTKSYTDIKLLDYVNNKLSESVYAFRDYELYQNISDLSLIDGPLAVIIEDKSCYDCDEFYDRMLSRDDVKEQLGKYTMVRINPDSETVITDVDGTERTSREFTDHYNMMYRPGVLLFDEGQLVRRHDSLAFSHHFKESLRFVSGKHYQAEDYQSYSERRTEELLSSGVDINLGD